jgi:hypothetical protein
MRPSLSRTPRSRRAIRRTAGLAAAVAALALLPSGLAGVAEAATSGSWTDPAGDAPAGVPDIRGVDAVRDATTFRFTITAPDTARLEADTFVWISVRAGDDAHLIEIDASENRISHYDWVDDGWTFRWVDVLTTTSTYPLQVAIDRAALGDPSLVRFTVTTAHYNAVASQPWTTDTTDVLTLDLGATPTPEPDAPGTPDIPAAPSAPAPTAEPGAAPSSGPAAPSGAGVPGVPTGVPSAPGGPDAPGAPAAPSGVPVLPTVGGPPAVPGASASVLRAGRVTIARRGNVVTVRVAVVDGLGHPVARGRVRCTAKVAGRTIAPLAARFENGRPTCRLRLAAGRSARLTVRIDAAGATVTRVVTVRHPR